MFGCHHYTTHTKFPLPIHDFPYSRCSRDFHLQSKLSKTTNEGGYWFRQGTNIFTDLKVTH